jgi:predicted transcriptional regulator
MPEEYGDNFGNEDRQKVLDVVSEAPGLNMWEIQKRLGQSLETVEPILNVLEQDGLLIVKEEGGFRRFYLHEEKPGDEKVEHTLLRKKVEQETGESFVLEARKKVFDIIAEAPGLHLREIQKRLNIPLGTVEYHLNYFEDNETVLVKEEGGYKRYYPKQAMGSEDRKLLSLLRQAIPRRIVLFLMHKPGATFGDIAQGLDMPPSSLAFHVKKLVTSDILERVKKGRVSYFKVKEPERTAKILIAHKRSFLDELVDRFVGTWTEYHP